METLPCGVLENVAGAAEEHDLPESVAGNIQCLELAVPLAALGRRESVAAAVVAAVAAVVAAVALVVTVVTVVAVAAVAVAAAAAGGLMLLQLVGCCCCCKGC